MPQRMQLPDIPDPPPNHRLRTLTFLATAGVLVASVASDSYAGGPVGEREHVFTHVRAPRRAHGEAPCAGVRARASSRAPLAHNVARLG